MEIEDNIGKLGKLVRNNNIEMLTDFKVDRKREFVKVMEYEMVQLKHALHG